MASFGIVLHIPNVLTISSKSAGLKRRMFILTETARL
jgi:hypothetical protein